jgi:hypothetical protein
VARHHRKRRKHARDRRIARTHTNMDCANIDGPRDYAANRSCVLEQLQQSDRSVRCCKRAGSTWGLIRKGCNARGCIDQSFSLPPRCSSRRYWRSICSWLGRGYAYQQLTADSGGSPFSAASSRGSSRWARSLDMSLPSAIIRAGFDQSRRLPGGDRTLPRRLPNERAHRPVDHRERRTVHGIEGTEVATNNAGDRI